MKSSPIWGQSWGMAGFCGNQGGQTSQAGQLNQPAPASQLGQQQQFTPVSSGLCNALPPPAADGTPGTPQKNPLAWAPVGFQRPQGRSGSGPAMV